MKLKVTSYRLQVIRRNPAAGGTFNFQLSTLNPVRAFSLVELLIVMALLSLIVIALMAVFSSTQRAFRAGVSQSDVMEGGRATMELIASDLRLMAASGGVSNLANGAVNFSVVDNNYSPALSYYPIVQQLPGGSDKRTNALNYFFMLGRENTKWIGVGYAVNVTNQDLFYPLYRFYAETNITESPRALFDLFLRQVDNGRWTNMSHIIDGVVHLVVRAYDPNGILITNGYSASMKRPPNVFSLPPVNGEIGVYFFGNTVPASVEIEFAKLEDHAIKRAESLNQNYTRLTNYLSNQSGNVHVFRKHVPIPNADRAAYQ